MAYFPIRQSVTITRSSGVDIYGKSTGGKTLTLKCRAVEGNHLAINRSGGTQGGTIVCDLKLLFDKIADITYDDYVTYTNESGTVYHARPKNIRIQRDFAGKPVLTEVLV